MGYSLGHRFTDHTSEVETGDFVAPNGEKKHISRDQRLILLAICLNIVQTEHFYGNPWGIPISKRKAEEFSGLRISSDLWCNILKTAEECEIFELSREVGSATRWIPGRALKCESGYQNCPAKEHAIHLTNPSGKQSTTSGKQSEVLEQSEATSLFAGDKKILNSSEYPLKSKYETQAAEESETEHSQTAKSVTTQKENLAEPEIERVTDNLEAELSPEWLQVAQKFEIKSPSRLAELIARSRRGESPPPPGDPFYRKIAPPSKSKQNNSPRV